MGSEHYCLRWNNHQSNLLGVFSQLLQDESLVDVTLACSEGASIRAHKVVLSACSSYFQSLFLDHPEKHPIVILKDVRLSELQTLVEFMYKGEVNVQYCQLSALLKTAESLKVKGLAEMTNQNTALREPEREPDRLRPHSQPTKLLSSSSTASSCDPQSSSPIMETPAISGLSTSSLISQHNLNSSTSLSAPATIVSSCPGSTLGTPGSSNNFSSAVVKRENDRSSLSPPKRLHTSSSPLPLDLYQRRCPSGGGGGGGTSGNRSERRGCGNSDRGSDDSPVQSRRTPLSDEQLIQISSPGKDRDRNQKDRDTNRQHHYSHRHHHQQQQQQHQSNSTDDEDDKNMNDIGINMIINPNGISSNSTSTIQQQQQSGGQSLSHTVVGPPINLSSTSSMHSTDLTRPSSHGSSGGGGGGGSSNITGSSSGNCGNLLTMSSNITHTATSSRISSPIISTAGASNEPVAGPSGLGPVQSVPLSLKKEIDWDRSDDNKTTVSSGGGGSSDTIDYRHSHDSETSESPRGLGGGGNSSCGTSLEPSGSSHNAAYPCLYCGVTFPHQSKLTRHILSHSLETLKYRETAAHLLHTTHISNLLPHELPPLPQHFSHRHGTTGSLDVMEPPDGGGGGGSGGGGSGGSGRSCGGGGDGRVSGNSSQMEIEFSAAAMAVAAAAATSLSGGGGGGSGDGISSLSSAALCSSGGNGSSAGTAAGSSLNDPNSVVLCKFCGKSFPDVASLITHLPVHTGDRPFKCEFCGKAFKLRHHMKDHCRVHTGERPFRCSMCGKTFSRSTILKAHEKTHFPKYVRKFLSTSPVDTKDELPQ